MTATAMGKAPEGTALVTNDFVLGSKLIHAGKGSLLLSVTVSEVLVMVPGPVTDSGKGMVSPTPDTAVLWGTVTVISPVVD